MTPDFSKPKPKESAIKTRIKKHLAQYGQHCWVMMPVPSPWAPRRGIPDFIGVLNGRFFYIETKQAGRKPRPLQVAVMKTLDLAGAKGWPSVDRLEPWAAEFDDWALRIIAGVQS